MLQGVKHRGVAEVRLPPNLEFVRQKYHMASSEFDEYWRLAAEAQVMKDILTIRKANTKAEHELKNIKVGDTLKGGLDEPGWQTYLPSHRELMEEALSALDIARLKDGDKGLFWRKLGKETRDLQGLLSDIQTPQATNRLLKNIERSILKLELRIATEKSYDPVVDPGDWEDFYRANAIALKAGMQARATRTTHRALWRERKRTAARLAENMADYKALRKRRRKEQRDEIGELETVLQSYKGHLETVKAALDKQTKELEKVRRQRREVLAKKHEMLKQLEENERATHQAKTVSGASKAKEQLRKPDAFDLDNILDEAIIETTRASRTLDAPRPLLVATTVERQVVQKNRGKPPLEQLPEPREALVKERQSKMAELLQGFDTSNPFTESAVLALDIATLMPPASDDRSQQVKKISDSVSMLKRFAARDPAVQQTTAKVKDLITDLETDTLEEMEASASPADKAPLQAMQEDTKTIESPRPVEAVVTFGSTNRPEPLPPSWPLSQNLPSSQFTVTDTNKYVVPLQRKPSDDLRLHVPSSGLINIDSELTVDFEATIPDLQMQIFSMQGRLKSSYPRIDTLPYNVWESTNQRTLQTWLKILVSRWQTRFDGVGKANGESSANEQVRSTLDQMVRDHDLSNEAAERMARRWQEVFDERWDMSGDAEGVLDWDELDAGGMSFLKDESGAQEVKSRQTHITVRAPTSQHRTGVAYRKADAPSYGSHARRLYSTSLRSPPDLNAASNDTSESTAAQPSLPHLTSTGTAHMVSVSAKAHTVRTAIAVGTVSFSNPTPLSLIRSNSLKKGDVLSVSRIAGIMAAKKCPELIPLCHPIALTHVSVELNVVDAKLGEGTGFGGVAVEAKVQCTGPTGVEMEALTAVMGAALSVVDMCKAVDRFQRVGDVRVVLKEGGKSGVWLEEGWRSMLS